MRIVFDHQAFSLQVTGGITRYFYQLATLLNQVPDVSTTTQLGFCTTIWPMAEASRPNGNVVKWGERIVPNGVGTYLINEALFRPYNLARGRVDVYHNTLYGFASGIRARAYVATHHDCTIERFPQLFREAAMVIKSKKAMLRKADLIFSITQSSLNDLVEFYDVDRSKVVVLTNPPGPLERSSAGADELKRLIKRPFLLYVGTRVAYKNFDGLLKGFAASGLASDYDLLVVGGGSFSDAERASLVSLKLASAVISVPLASSELLAEAYANATAFVYPSLYEGLGLPPLEAMEKGCRVLVSSNPACMEVCKDGALYFDPVREDDLVQKLQTIVEDSTENRMRVQRGFQVRSLYSWDPVIRGMVDSYQSLL